jgi:5-methylcytosine-specific restriction protein A
MNSLKEVVSRLTSHLGVELRAELISRDPVNIEIRFDGVSETEFIHFCLTRQWASTTITLVPDIFGLEAWKMVGSDLARNTEKIKNFLNNNMSSVSEVRFNLGGSPIQNFQGTKKETDLTWSFEADILISNSLIGDGLVSESEYDLIKYSLEIFIPFLPISFDSFTSPDEVAGYPEGASTKVLVNKYERSVKNRKICIAHYGSICQACGFDFALKYGEIGDGFIIVHHIVPVSKIGPNYVIDPITDLVPLCANCHAIIHRNDPPLSISDLKSKLKNVGN